MEPRKKTLIASVKAALVRKKSQSLLLQAIWLETLRFRGLRNLRKYGDKEAILKLYRDYAGFSPNLEKPERFSEKMQWLKLNYRNSQQSICADKHAVREWLIGLGYENLLNEQLAVISDMEDFDINALPDRFVVKAAHSSGWNLVCSDKKMVSWSQAKLVMASWLRQGIFWNGREWPYLDIPNRIVIEKFLQDDSGGLRDYKLYCFNGVPKFFQANAGREGIDHAQNFYDLNWNLLPFGKDLAPRHDIDIRRPKNFDRMVEVSQVLAENFPFVRIDFYEVGEQLIFGEMTFYPASGLPDFRPDEQDLKCGEMLDLAAFM